MIAADTSSLIAYLSGEKGSDVDAVDTALSESQACLPPVVLTELLSDPGLTNQARGFLEQIPILELSDGYWTRAGLLRSRILSKKLRARLADTLIAQSCLDHGVPLIARDADYRHFARIAGLKLIPLD